MNRFWALMVVGLSVLSGVGLLLSAQTILIQDGPTVPTGESGSSGFFAPAPYGEEDPRVSITYTVTGATLGESTDTLRNGMHMCSRGYEGSTLGVGTLQVSGSVRFHRYCSHSIKVTLVAGEEHAEWYHEDMHDGGTVTIPFSLAIDIPQGATSGSFLIWATAWNPRTGASRPVRVYGRLSRDGRLEVTLSYFPEDPTTEDMMVFTTEVTAPDGVPLSYNWFLNGALLPGVTTHGARWNEPSAGTHTVRVVVSDDEARQAEDSVTFTVKEAFAVTLSYSPEQPTIEDTIVFTTEVTAPQGAQLTYNWFVNDVHLSDVRSRGATWDDPSAGTHTVRVVVSDREGRQAEDSVTFTVRPRRYVIVPGRTDEGELIAFVDKVFVDGREDPGAERTLLYKEASVRTGPGVEIWLRYMAGPVVRVREDTHFEIVGPRRPKNDGLGAMFNRLWEGIIEFYRGDPGEQKFGVETRTASTGIRGTEMTLKHIAGVTTVIVHTGEVEVTDKASGETISVRAGESVTIEGPPLLGSTAGPGWTLLGLPVDPESANPDALEIDPEPAFSYLYRWDPGTRRYLAAHRGEITELEELHGYWLFLSREHAAYEVCVEGTALTGEQEVELGPVGWQMIGVPYPVAWGDVDGGSMRFRSNTDEKTLAEAITAGWVLNTIYAWDSTEGAWIRYRAVDGETLEPWTGYFLYTLQDDLELIFSEEQAAWPAGFALSVAAQAFDPGEPPLPVLPVELPVQGLDALAYPNPVGDGGGATFTVRGPAARWVEAISVRVHDLSGRLVYQGEGDGGSLLWDTLGVTGVPVASGVYLYTVQVKLDGEWVSAAAEKLLILR